MESRAIRLEKLPRLSKIRAGSIVAVLAVVALVLSTFIGSTSAQAEKTDVASGARVASTNNTPNPGIDVDCEKPILTIAITIDRSGSVWGRQNTYINTVNTFVNDLYNKFVLSGGEVRLIVFSFATRSVIQNSTTGPSNQLVVSMTDESSRDNILETISQIHFRQGANGNDYFSRSNSAFDRARGYNPTLGGNIGWHFTNYDDALLDIARIASTPYFNNSDPGRHIDLALFLTDGQPNIHNGSSRNFNAANVPPSINNSTYVNQGVDYAAQTVTALRTGSSLPGIPSRPPMAVRGVLIEANAAQYMERVFGSGPQNFLFASNFGSELNKQLDEIVNSLSEGICALEVVTPSIQVSVNPGDISIREEQSRSYTITVSNTSPVPVTNLVITINGVYFTTIANLGPQGAPDGVATRTNTITFPLGGSLPSSLNINVTGTATPTSTQRFADGSSEKLVSDGDSVGLSFTRLALPA